MSATTALQTIAQSAIISKAGQAATVDDLVAQVTGGNVDPIQAFVQMKAIGEIAGQFIKHPDIVSLTQGETITRGKDASFGGAKVGIAYTTRYDFTMCGDAEYDALIREKESLDAKIKAREMFLKSIPEKVDVVDKETGELVSICAPLATKSSSIRVTFSKQ